MQTGSAVQQSSQRSAGQAASQPQTGPVQQTTKQGGIPAPISTATIQEYLEQNQRYIHAILENQNLGKLEEAVQYQQRLQRNLIYLASIADAQPGTNAPGTKPLLHGQQLPVKPASGGASKPAPAQAWKTNPSGAIQPHAPALPHQQPRQQPHPDPRSFTNQPYNPQQQARVGPPPSQVQPVHFPQTQNQPLQVNDAAMLQRQQDIYQMQRLQQQGQPQQQMSQYHMQDIHHMQARQHPPQQQ